MIFIVPAVILRAVATAVRLIGKAVGGTKQPPKLRGDVKIEWFVDQVDEEVGRQSELRVKLATEHVFAKTVRNISKAVKIVRGPRGGRVVIRSKPGEFPRAETTQLMKTLFRDVRQVRRGVYEGTIGTPLDYGVILETRMNRSFMKRTLEEELPQVRKILTKKF